MKFAELSSYFDHLADNIMADVPDIVAETAVEYYKETFSKKGFRRAGVASGEGSEAPNGVPPGRKRCPGKQHPPLQFIEPHRVGDIGWRRQGNLRPGTQRRGERSRNHTWRTPGERRKGPVNVKQHSRNVRLPKRQFMGASNELGCKAGATY